MVVSNGAFNEQIESLIKEYPNFQMKTDLEYPYLKGILDIPDDEGIVAGSFSVEIHPTSDFPNAFPILYEVGGEIPCEVDWHKYPDSSCCLTVRAKEKLMCKNGITLVWFVQNMAIPYFANQLCRKQTGSYLHEYSHGAKGIWEFYKELFHSQNPEIWKRCLDNTFSNGKNKRNVQCYCNSGKKYKKCHMPIENDVAKIGKEQIIKDFKIMRLI